MGDPEQENSATIDLGEEEAWVLHAALLDHLDQQADGESREPVAVDLLEQVEEGQTLLLERDRVELLREILAEYLAGAPLRDRAICRAVLREVREDL